VTKEVANLGLKIEAVAIQKLLSCVGNDSWLLSQEINKLVNYKAAAGEDIIIATDVDLLVTPKEDFNVFGIVDAVSNRNRLRAVKLIHDHFESNADPYYIFSMIIYQFRNLLRIKDLAKNAVPYSSIIKQTGLKPFVVRKTYEQCKKYDLDELKALFIKLAGLDLAAKNGEIELTDGLYKLVFSI
jgi:DNA polymerase-3 subunit delta